MSKKNKEDKKFYIAIDDVKIALFEGCGFELPVNELPPGVKSMSTIQVKFDTPGQHLWGRFICSEQIKSNNPKMKDYMFHTLELDNGALVGFCGSAQVDRTLSLITNDMTDVHIIYAGEKDIGNKQTLKQYHIYQRQHLDDKITNDSHDSPAGSTAGKWSTN